MEFKGTKGHWIAREDVDKRFKQPVVQIDVDEHIETLITVWSGLDMDQPVDDETKANALLISKAPELLEKLISILYMSEDKGVEGCTWGDTEMSSTDVAYGYNLALENVKSGLEELIKSATQI